MEQPQGQFRDWAVVEVMGHQQHVGFVTSEAYGGHVLFRVDVPELPERECVLDTPQYVDGTYAPAGSVVRRPCSPAHTTLLSVAAIFRLTPCTEEVARQTLDRAQRAPLTLISLAPRPLLPAESEEEEF